MKALEPTQARTMKPQMTKSLINPQLGQVPAPGMPVQGLELEVAMGEEELARRGVLVVEAEQPMEEGVVLRVQFHQKAQRPFAPFLIVPWF